MTGIRRALLLVGLTVAVTAGASVPAWAAYDDSDRIDLTINTITVAPPSSVSVDGRCSTTSNTYWNGRNWVTSYSYWYTATVTWSASSTPRGVTGYRVMAYLNNGTSTVLAETNATTRTASATVDRAYLNYQPRISVFTLTSYGWTAESPKTGVLTC
jgi:hypothetical protein